MNIWPVSGGSDGSNISIGFEAVFDVSIEIGVAVPVGGCGVLVGVLVCLGAMVGNGVVGSVVGGMMVDVAVGS